MTKWWDIYMGTTMIHLLEAFSNALSDQTIALKNDWTIPIVLDGIEDTIFKLRRETTRLEQQKLQSL